MRSSLLAYGSLLCLATGCCPTTQGPREPVHRPRTAAPQPALPKTEPSEDTAAPMVAPLPLIQNVDARQVVSLNGAWHVIIDPYEVGYRTYHGQPQVEESYFANDKPTSKSDRVEYDFDASETLQVPGDWNSQKRELFFYEGTVWYKTDFGFHPEPGRRTFVHFGAANYDAKVALNGQSLGEHQGGFTPFNFEVTQQLRSGNNFLVVKVDNTRRRENVPTTNTDWWNYGGLTRDVSLVSVPETFVRDYSIRLDATVPNQIVGWVQLDGPEPAQAVAVRIPEVRAETTVRTSDDGYAEFALGAQLQRWEPERPRLYEVQFEAQTDRVSEHIGFRTVEVQGQDILINGEPVFLRGISIHEEAPLRQGRAHSEADARKLLGWARELGANFVRLAHYPHNRHMTRVADELGLLVWSEIPVYWTILWGNLGTLQSAKQQLTEMISRDRNRASVILWSVGNETPREDARLRFMAGLIQKARELDSSRLISAALERRGVDEHTTLIDDPLGAELDVIGCNEYLGWYDGLPEKAAQTSWKSSYDKPLIITEFGAGALQGHHGDALTRWTEEYQANVYEQQVTMLKGIPFLRGLTPWILVDFRSPRRPLPKIQDYWNRKGLISDQGKKKQAFQVLRKHYEEIARSR